MAYESRQKIEKFFREYLGDENFSLPEICFFAGKLSGFLAFVLKIHGITIGKHIFLAPELITLNQDNRKLLPKNLAIHEIVHVLQYRREGFFRFLLKYLTDYWRNLQKKRDWSAISRLEAYREISFEIEAREIAGQYLKWEKELKNK